MLYTKPDITETMITHQIQEAARGLYVPSRCYDDFIADCVQSAADYVDTFGTLPKDMYTIVHYVAHLYGLLEEEDMP